MREQSGVRERVELPLDAVLLIEEPPAAAELDLAGLAPSWKLPIIVAKAWLSDGFML